MRQNVLNTPWDKPRCILYQRLIPESPRWLLSKKRQRQAEVVLKKAAHWNKTSLPANILENVRIEEEPSYRHFLKVFKSLKMLLITAITCFNW